MSQAKSPIAWSAHLKRTLQLGDSSARESVNFPILIEFNIFKEMNGETNWLIDNISKKMMNIKEKAGSISWHDPRMFIFSRLTDSMAPSYHFLVA